MYDFYVAQVVEENLMKMKNNRLTFDFKPNFSKKPWVRVEVKRIKKRWLMIFDLNPSSCIFCKIGVNFIENNARNPSILFEGCKLEEHNRTILVVSTDDCSIKDLSYPLRVWLFYVRTLLENKECVM